MKPMQWLALGALGAVLATPVAAQNYPSKPVTIISAQASGGASDTVVRAVQDRMQAALGQPLVLENRPGAGGNVGAAVVARAAPDGYTLMVGTDAMMTSNVHLYKSMGFDPVKDFVPITNAGANIIVLAVHADVPVKSVAELVAYAKANPGKVQYGSSGVASPHHLAGELLKLKTGIDIVHVPYRGGALSANDLAGGHIAMAFRELFGHRRPHPDRQDQDSRAWSRRPATPACRTCRRSARPFRASRCRRGSASSRRPGRLRRSSRGCTTSSSRCSGSTP